MKPNPRMSPGIPLPETNKVMKPRFSVSRLAHNYTETSLGTKDPLEPILVMSPGIPLPR
jgi:hypothetical protein